MVTKLKMQQKKDLNAENEVKSTNEDVSLLVDGAEANESIKKPLVNKEIVEKVKKDMKKQMNIPNLLTLFRIWAIPGIVLTFFFNTATAAWFGVLLFALAGISDYLDGYLARHWNQLSRFGRVLDPIADKLLVGAMLLMLAYTARLGDWGIIPAVVILCREILVSGLREFLREVNVGMPVTRLAKWKTGFQMTALSMMLLKGFWYWGEIGEFLLWIAGVLTFITGYQYFQKSLDYICETEKCAKMPVMPKITLPKIDVNLEAVKQKAKK